MQLTRLALTQFRAFEQATFDFQSGMNLLVGINGVGKSTVLDALAILLSQALPKITASRSKRRNVGVSDITVGQGALTAELQFEAAGISFTHLVHLPRERYTPEIGREGDVRRQAIEQIPRSDLRPNGRRIPKHLKVAPTQPLAVYFSTRRSLPDMSTPSSQRSAGGQASAFADALTHRGLRVLEFADWWLVQELLALETDDPLRRRRIVALEEVIGRFLDTFTNLRALDERHISLQLDKAGVTLTVEQLSDGERGILALVLDLAKRLSQANPALDEPLRDGQAVVLIDELDLHLHPRWQRGIVEKLTATFPSCQFIATTHSPQIVGEVPPEKIILLETGRAPVRPDQSLGMDSNWVLQYLMGAGERKIETRLELDRIAKMIEDEHYDEATAAIEVLRNQLGDFPELVRLQTRIDRIRLSGE